MKKSHFLFFFLCLFLSCCAASRTTTITLKPENFIPSIYHTGYAIFKGQQVYLSPINNKDPDIGEGGWFYYGSSSSIMYAADNSIEEYLQSCFEKTLKQAGALVYAAQSTRSAAGGIFPREYIQSEKRTVPTEAKDIQIVINKFKYSKIDFTVTLFTKNTITFQKDMTCTSIGAEESNRAYIETRTNEFYNKIVSSVLLDSDFQTAFMK